MKNSVKSLLTLLCLSGCIQTYQPELAFPVPNKEQYDADLESCKDYVRFHPVTPSAGQAMAGALGPLGVLAYYSSSDENKEYYKSLRERVNDCLAKKGYKVTS